jgi:deoxyribonuclease-2
LKLPGSTDYLCWDNALSTRSEFRYSAGAAVDDFHSSALMLTLAQIYDDSSNSIAYAMYNDETPNKATHSSRAHSKGVIAFDPVTESGFWLTHSLPAFPNTVADGLNYLPDHTYAQHFFCVSINGEGFNQLSKQMAINYPYVYDQNLPSSLKSSSFNDWISGELRGSLGNSSVVEINSLGGTSLISFAKSKVFGMDLWDSLVTSHVQSDIVVQSWKNGDGINMPSSCGSNGYQFQVMNLEDVQVSSFSWKATKDHSKWAATHSSSRNTVCFGDINRQVSQTKRGGGAVCVEDSNLWNAFNSIIDTFELCGSEIL